MPEFNDRRAEPKRAPFDKRTDCKSCSGYGRNVVSQTPHPDFPFATVTKTRACGSCGGVGRV